MGQFARINGAQLYYEVAGEGEPLVFVHAGIADNRLWDGQFEEFSKSYKVVRYDMRGFGKSEPVEGEFAHRDDLFELLKYLNIERAHLVGCSMGGGFSMDVALNHPDMAASLTIVCSGPNGMDVELPEVPRLSELEEQAQEAWKTKDIEKTAELETQIFFDGVARTPDQVDATARAKAVEMNRIALTHQAKELGQHKAPLQPPAAQRLNELNIPVLAIVGEYDEPYVHIAGDYMEQHIANCRKVIMPNTAHLPSLEHPQEFNRILREFLNSL